MKFVFLYSQVNKIILDTLLDNSEHALIVVKDVVYAYICTYRTRFNKGSSVLVATLLRNQGKIALQEPKK